MIEVSFYQRSLRLIRGFEVGWTVVCSRCTDSFPSKKCEKGASSHPETAIMQDYACFSVPTWFNPIKKEMSPIKVQWAAFAFPLKMHRLISFFDGRALYSSCR